MLKLKVKLLPDERTTKPMTPEEKRQWAIELGAAPEVELTIEHLAGIVGEMGCSFNHASYNDNWIAGKNFACSQLLIVDIDDSITPNEMFERCQSYGISPPNIIYRTLSDPTDPALTVEEKLRVTKKYRAIFVLENLIIDFATYNEFVFNGTYVLFPESDRVGAVQKWLGGQEVIHLDTESRLNPIHYLNAAHAYGVKHLIKPQTKSKHYKKEIKAIPSKLTKGDSFDAANQGSKTSNPYSIHKALAKNDPINNFDWEGARIEFPFLDEFLNASRRFHHIELRGLYSSMKRIVGGKKRWRQAVLKNKMISDDKINDIARWVDDYEQAGNTYYEERIENYSPTNATDLKFQRITDFHFRKGRHAQLLASVEMRSLADGEIKLAEGVEDAINSGDKTPWVIKAPTGIGKTNIIIRAIKDGCVYAVPTHALKNEVAERFRAQGVEVNVAPDEPELPHQIYQEHLQYLNIGAYLDAAKFLRNLANKAIGIRYGLSDPETLALMKKMKQYFSELDKCLESPTPVICTHKRMLFSKFPKHHTFIVDEDIFPVLNELQSFKVKDLRLLISNVGRSTYEGQENDLRILTDILEALNKDDALGLPQTYTFPRPAEFSNFKEITNAAHRSSSKINGEIISFFTSNSFTVELSDIEDTGGEREVYFITKRGLPEDKKIIVLSATVNKFLYDHVFVDFNWLDISHVEHAGRCIQFSDLSHSRSTLANENNKKVLSRIVHFLGTTAVITFKKYQNLFEHSVDICIENCSGFDGLKGRDIAVIGTPHLPVTVYKMIAFALGIDFTDEDLEMSEQLVIHNGYRFKIMTFNHIGLRNIQFHFIESALVQACGRGRTIRENSTVYLFANYPLVGFEQRSSNELPDPEFIDLPDIDILRDQGRIIHLPSASGSIAS